MLSAAVNFAIAGITFAVLYISLRKDGHWDREKVRFSFRFFTVQSNVLSAAAALAMGIAQLTGTVPVSVWLFKYVGTSAVTVTLMTVLIYLAPSIGSLKKLISGDGFHMHLSGPVMAILSFSFLEKRPMGFLQSLWGMIPVVLYGILYLYKVVVLPGERGWDDFYGFNSKGKWTVSFLAMMAGSFLICMGLRALQNLP